jgi:hypothetical protein
LRFALEVFGEIHQRWIKFLDFEVNGAFDERKMPEGGVTLVGFEL